MSEELKFTDKDNDDFLNFIAEKVKDVTNPFNFKELCSEYKEESGTPDSEEILMNRLRVIRLRIHRLKDFDNDTKVKMLFGLGASVDYGFLEELKKEADVEVDKYNRITKYEKKGERGLQLNVFIHSFFSLRFPGETVRYMLYFCAKISRTRNTPMTVDDFLKEYADSYYSMQSKSSLEKRYNFLKHYLHMATEYDIPTRIKMLFVTGARVDRFFLKVIRKDAVVDVDDEGMITKYEAHDGSLTLGESQNESDGSEGSGETNLSFESEETNLSFESVETNLSYKSDETNLSYKSEKTNFSDDSKEAGENYESYESDEVEECKETEEIEESYESDVEQQDENKDPFKTQVDSEVKKVKEEANSDDLSEERVRTNGINTTQTAVVEPATHVKMEETEEADESDDESKEPDESDESDESDVEEQNENKEPSDTQVDSEIRKVKEEVNNDDLSEERVRTNGINTQISVVNPTMPVEKEETAEADKSDEGEETEEIEEINADQQEKNKKPFDTQVDFEVNEVEKGNKESSSDDLADERVKNDGINTQTSVVNPTTPLKKQGTEESDETEETDESDTEESDESDDESEETDKSAESKESKEVDESDESYEPERTDETEESEESEVEQQNDVEVNTNLSVTRSGRVSKKIYPTADFFANHGDDQFFRNRRRRSRLQHLKSKQSNAVVDDDSPNTSSNNAMIIALPSSDSHSSSENDDVEFDGPSNEDNEVAAKSSESTRTSKNGDGTDKKKAAKSAESASKIQKISDEKSKVLANSSAQNEGKINTKTNNKKNKVVPSKKNKDDADAEKVTKSVDSTSKIQKISSEKPTASTLSKAKNGEKMNIKKVTDPIKTTSTPKINEDKGSKTVQKKKNINKTTPKTENKKRKLASTTSGSTAAKIAKKSEKSASKNPSEENQENEKPQEDDLIYEGGDPPLPIPIMPRKTEEVMDYQEQIDNLFDYQNAPIEFGNSQLLPDYQHDNDVKLEEMDHLEAIRDASFAPVNSSLPTKNGETQGIGIASSEDILKVLRSLVRCLDAPMVMLRETSKKNLQEFLKKIDDAMEKMRFEDHNVASDEMMTILNASLQNVTKSAPSTTSSEDSMSLQLFLCFLRSILITLSIPALDDFQETVNENIRELAGQDKMISIERIRRSLEIVLTLAVS